jgi:GNAT superfamily N-acetyltransferase
MTPAGAEAALWAAFVRNRNVDVETAGDGAVAVAGGYGLCLAGTDIDLALGAGTTRPLRGDDLAVLRAFYDARGLPLRVEIDDAVLARDRAVLSAAGLHEERDRRIVLERSLDALDADTHAITTTHDLAAWSALAASSIDGRSANPERELRTLRAAGAAAQRLVLAQVDGIPIGAGAVAVVGDVALLYGGHVLPAFRGRGLYRALVAVRFDFARGNGATRASLAVAPNSEAERAARALGFTTVAERVRLRAS